MARMYGAYLRPRCSHCRTASGPDCADSSRGKGRQRRYEERQWRRDWDQDIDDAQQERYLDRFYDYRPVWAPTHLYDETRNRACHA